MAKKQVRDARRRADGANIVVVLPHWGTKNRAKTPDRATMAREWRSRRGCDFRHTSQWRRASNGCKPLSDDHAKRSSVFAGCLLTDARTAKIRGHGGSAGNP
ncbi:MAG: hypothetical protein ACLVJB_08120 [Christensenellales bacterium]